MHRLLASYGSAAAGFLQLGRHSALCMPSPSPHRGQRIVRPCSLTKASVSYQRFWVAASCAFSSDASADRRCVCHLEVQGWFCTARCHRTLRLGIARVANKPVYILTSPSGCLRLPPDTSDLALGVLIATQVLVGVHCLAQPAQANSLRTCQATASFLQLVPKRLLHHKQARHCSSCFANTS